MKEIVRRLFPYSRVSSSSWLWDNMYCVWKPRMGRTVKDAILCQFTHYINSKNPPNYEPDKGN